MIRALRLLRVGREPAYLTLSVLTMALAVGANLVVFTIVNALWLRERPMPHPDRVMMLLPENRQFATTEGGFLTGDVGLARLRDLPVFSRVAAQVSTTGLNAEYQPHVTVARAGREVESLAVTSQYFSVVGTYVRGRDFTVDDDRVGADPVAIMSDRLWRSVFGAEGSVLGSVVEASPVRLRIVGIAPPGFEGVRLGEHTELWVPSGITPLLSTARLAAKSDLPLLAIVRLQDGVRRPDAAAAVGIALRQLPVTFAVVPVNELYGGPRSGTIVVDERGPVIVAAATAVLILVAGWATLMSLVLMHYERRRQEFAICLALGSSRGRLAGALARELSALAVAGLGGAVATALVAIRAIPALTFTSGVDFSRLDLSLDWRVMAVGAIGSTITLALAAMMPLRRATQAALALEIAGAASKSAATSFALRRVLLGIHTAATVVVLLGAALFLRTIRDGFSEGPGFDLRRSLFVTAQVDSTKEPNAGDLDALAATRLAHAQDLIEHIVAIPGVNAGEVGDAPIGLDQSAAASRTAFLKSDRASFAGPIRFAWVGPRYFQTIGIPILAGRALADTDIVVRDGKPHVHPVVITMSLSNSLWPGGSAIGQEFHSADATYEVVGAVADFAQGSFRLNERRGVFAATDLRQAMRGSRLALSVRAGGDPAGLVEPVRKFLLAAFPDAVGVDIVSGPEVMRRDLGRERLGASYFSGFGAVAFCLGVATVFGLVGYLVEAQHREFGVRMALGATPAILIRAAAMTGVVPVLCGTIGGLLVAGVLARVAQAFLEGLSGDDVMSYITVAALLMAGATLASLSAAARLARLSPTEALRTD